LPLVMTTGFKNAALIGDHSGGNKNSTKSLRRPEWSGKLCNPLAQTSWDWAVEPKTRLRSKRVDWARSATELQTFVTSSYHGKQAV